MHSMENDKQKVVLVTRMSFLLVWLRLQLMLTFQLGPREAGMHALLCPLSYLAVCGKTLFLSLLQGLQRITHTLSFCQRLPLVYPGEKNQYILGWSSCQLSNKAIVMPGSGVCILICFCSPVVYVQHFQLHLSVSAVSNKELNSNKEGRKRMCVCQSGCLAKLLSYFVFIIYLPLSHILAFFLFLTKIIMWVNE